jgi:hypothetical protein
MAKATVILFKPSGKYYTEEEWEIPADVPNKITGGVRPVIIPNDMLHSKDFRRISGGAVLVPAQEPWGYPHLFPSSLIQLVSALEPRLDDES